MLIEVKVPVLPESVAEATLVNWHKKAGDPVNRDENLVDVETDKVVLELPAPGSGVIAEIRKADGSTVAAQEVIAVIDTDGKAASAGPASTAQPKAPSAAPPAAPAPQAHADAGALPAARKMMAESGLQAAEVTGTGRGGRITKGDVLAASEGREAAAPAPAARAPQPAPTPPAPAPTPATVKPPSELG